ncbi:MAG TPA: response regulator [Spirochaetia bacterium]|nr:response regulator [Spirochaetia bacterium]
MMDHTPPCVLVADDEQSIRGLVREILERNHYCVRISADGAEALELLDSGAHFDCLVTDILMPKMSGIELALRLHETQPTLPVVMISGRIFVNSDSLRNLAPMMNNPCLLAKPFTPGTLLAAVKSAIARSCAGP